MAVKPLWIVIAAGLLAAALRLPRLGRVGRTVLGLLAILAGLFGTGVIHPPTIEEIVTNIGDSLGTWTYALVGVNAFLETGAFLGFIAPGETMVLFGGVLAGSGTIDLRILIVVTWLCCLAGDLSAYWIGRTRGRAFLLRHGARVKIGEPQVEFVEGFFARRGRMTLLLGRWVGVVRPLVPFLAGSSRMRFWEFLAIDLVSTLAWSAGLCVLGSIFWHNFDQLVTLVGQALFGLGTLIVVGAALAFGANARRDPNKHARVDAWIDAQRTERPLVARPAAALWALMGRIEPRLPGAARARAAAEPGTVPAGSPQSTPQRSPDSTLR